MFVQVPVIAQYKGKRYNLESDNAQELISKLESEIGISSVSESVALFRGKKLAPEERFEDIGVTPGDVIDITMSVLIVEVYFQFASSRYHFVS